jgi:hypothetical protein
MDASCPLPLLDSLTLISVPVTLLTSTSTTSDPIIESAEESSTDLMIPPGQEGCHIEGDFYRDGMQVSIQLFSYLYRRYAGYFHLFSSVDIKRPIYRLQPPLPAGPSFLNARQYEPPLPYLLSCSCYS